MKKIANLIFITIFTFALLYSSLVFGVSAADATIDFGGKSSVTVGDSVTVKVTVKGSYLTGTDINISYDSDILKYVSGGDDGGAGLVHIVDQNIEEGSKTTTYSLKFSAKASGRCTVAVEGLKSDGIPAEDVEVGASAKITVNDPELSSNAKLKSLSVSEGTLSPRFSASVTSYSVKVDNSVTQCTVSAKAADSDAKVAISKSNPMKLKVGSNTCKITVTAPNGSEKTYTVVIKRSDDSSENESSSEDNTSSEEENESNPLQTTVDGSEFVVAKDISSVELFKGFTVAETEFNGETVSIAKDESGAFEVYYLSNAKGEELSPYIYDSISGNFNKLAYINQGDFTYIISEFPEDKKATDGFYVTNTKISDFDIRCYAASSSKLQDFYYLYCFNGKDFDTYRYDSAENVLQRCPDFVLNDENASIDDSSLNQSTNAGNSDDSFISRFNSLTSNAKIIILSLGLMALGVIALIVLFAIKLLRRSNSDMEEDFDDGFDTFEINDNSDNDSQNN